MKRKLLSLSVIGIIAAGATLFYFKVYAAGTSSLRLPGTVEIQEVRLSSKIGGRVAKVVVTEGQFVEPGQPLVYLEAPELEKQLDQAKAKLHAAQAQLEKARNGARAEEKRAAHASLKAMEARLDRLRAGSRVEEIAQARAELDMAQAEVERANSALQRENRLLQSNATAKQQLEDAHAAVGRWQGQLKANKAKLDLLLAGTRPEEIAEAQAEVERARANHELLQTGSRTEDILEAEARVAELRSRVEEIMVNLREAVVLAPEKAVVEVVTVRKGDTVAPNQPVARVLRAEDLWVKAYVPETQLGKVRLNQAVQVTVDSHPGQRFEGQILQIATISEFTPRNVQSADERRHQVFAIKVRIADSRGVFQSGMAADVIVPLAD